MTSSFQPWLIQCLKRKFLKSFLELLELKCMAVEEKQLYLRGGSRPKIKPCLNMFEYWLNDSLSGNLVSFYIVSLVFKLLFSSRLGIIIRFVQVWNLFCNWTLSTRVTGETSELSASNARIIWGGCGGMLPGKIFENWTLGNAISCIPWIERN